MRTTGLLFCMLFYCACVQAQTAPPVVSFSYDKDGNMTARYVAAVKAPMTRSSDSDTTGHKKLPAEDELSITLEGRKITIYPNPTAGNITLGVVPLDSRQKNFLRLSDSLGRLLLTVQIQSELTPLEIRGPAGIYLLDIYLGENVSKWKIIKE